MGRRTVGLQGGGDHRSVSSHRDMHTVAMYGPLRAPCSIVFSIGHEKLPVCTGSVVFCNQIGAEFNSHEPDVRFQYRDLRLNYE